MKISTRTPEKTIKIEKYKNALFRKRDKSIDVRNSVDLGTLWEQFKTSVLEVYEEICGISERTTK